MFIGDPVILRILAAVVTAVLLTVSMAVAGFAQSPSADRLLIVDGPSGYQPLPPATGMTGPTAEHERKGAKWGGEVVSDDGFMRQWAGPCATVVGFALVWNDQDIAKAALTSDVDDAVNDGVEVDTVPAVPGARLISLPLSTPGGPAETETVLFRRGGAMFGFTGWNVPRAVLVAFAARQDARARELLDPARMLPDGAAAAALGPEKRVCGHAPAQAEVAGADGGAARVAVPPAAKRKGTAARRQGRSDMSAAKQKRAAPSDATRTSAGTNAATGVVSVSSVDSDSGVVDTTSTAYRSGRITGVVVLVLLLGLLGANHVQRLRGRRRTPEGAAVSTGEWSSTL